MEIKTNIGHSYSFFSLKRSRDPNESKCNYICIAFI